jgi:protein-L-isoaspartate(D-aspartate) O-methyltransferase
MPQLIRHLREAGVLRSSSITNALKLVDRADFVPEEVRQAAYEDIPLPIGYNQTISQPYTVVFMLEQLYVSKGHRVLEAGYGSGWQTALLAYLVGETGSVYAFEIISALAEFGRKNISKYPKLDRRISLFNTTAANGLSAASPFDRIICGAEVREVPSAWREQLRSGGRLVYPYKQGIAAEVKQANGHFKTSFFPGFVFVPFVESRR